MFSIGAGLLNTARKTFAKVTIILQRDAIPATADVSARRMNVDVETIEEFEGFITAHDSQFVIELADYLINGSRVEPKSGDVIVDGDQTFELLSLRGVGVWQYHASKTCYLVYGKAVTINHV